MHAPLESNFLVPTGSYFVLFVALAVFGLSVIWPLAETLIRQKWGYALGVILLGPIGGLVWFLVGRREATR